jgi:predicted nuclease with RNAse H fold
VPTALGIDVGVRKGLDLVLLDDAGRTVDVKRHASTDDVLLSLRTFEPDVVAIDSPPTWGTSGGLRTAERELLRLGIHSYGTPSDPLRQRSRFYDWMREGFRAFEAAASRRYLPYTGGSAHHTAMEVFPHASAVALAGHLPPSGLTRTARAEWRAGVLRDHGISTSMLRGPDQVDAGLAAMTGLRALEGRFVTVGEPGDGLIVLPLERVPDGPFGRSTVRAMGNGAVILPGLHRCECGCGAVVSRRFLPGHDAKLRSRLIREMRAGEAARAEMRRLGWAMQTKETT